MIRKLSLLGILCFSMVFMVACNSTSTTNAVAVLDTTKILEGSVIGKQAIAFIEDMQSKVEAEVMKLQEEYQKNPENLYLQQVVQVVSMQLQQYMGAEQQAVATSYNDLLQTVLDEYRASKGIKVVLPTSTLLNYDSAVDISADVIALLDTKTLTFKEASPVTPAEIVKQILESIPKPEEAPADTETEEAPEPVTEPAPEAETPAE